MHQLGLGVGGDFQLHTGLVTHHEYPTGQEIRTTKIAATLKAMGHNITVYCPGSAESSAKGEFESGTIERLNNRRLPFASLLLVPLPINPVWYSWLLFKAKYAKLDMLIVRDLRLSLPAIFTARTLQIPCVLDIGEHYPGMMKISDNTKWYHCIIRNIFLIETLEKFSVKWASAVWVVVQGNKERLLKYNSNIEVISNYPDISRSYTSSLQGEIVEYSESGPPVKFVSFGIVDNIRGLDLALEAFAALLKEMPNIRFEVYGSGDFLPILQQLADGLEVSDKVLFAGWVDPALKYEKIQSCDVGILLHRVCELTNSTIPNKLFDYMLSGLPILSTKMGPVQKIVEESECGVVVDENVGSVKQGMKGLIYNVSMREHSKRHGPMIIVEKYRWELECEKIKSVVNQLCRHPGGN